MNKMDLYRNTKSQVRTPGKSKIAQTMANTLSQPTITNPDGFPAFAERGIWQEYARTVMANLIKGEFYKDSQISANEVADIHMKALNQNFEMYLKGLIKSRDMNLKAQPQIGLAVFMSQVSAALWKTSKDGVSYEDILVELLATMAPKQMLGVAEMLRNKVLGGVGLGTAAKRVFSRAMGTWSTKYAEYYAVTYKDEINQLLRMIHPSARYFTADAYKVLRAAIDNNGPVTQRQKVAFDLASNPNVTMTDDKFGQLLVDWDINWEQTKALRNIQTPRSWFARMMQMSINALLLNLASLESHNVFSFPEANIWLQIKMSEAGKARILPFNIVRAYKNVRLQSTKDALAKAFASAFQYKMPEWEDKSVLALIDISGSMDGDALSYAASIAASLLPSLKQEKLTVATFNTALYLEGQEGCFGQQYANSRYNSQISNAIKCPKIVGEDPKNVLKRLFELNANGGTNSGVGIEYLLHNGIYKDIILLITDEQQNTGHSAYRAFNEYKRRINRDALLVIVNPTTYQWHNYFQNDPSIITVNTVTPTIFKALPQLSKAEEIIAGVDLGKFVNNARSRREKYKDNYKVQFIQ